MIPVQNSFELNSHKKKALKDSNYQVGEAVRGKNGIYRKERQKIESNTEAFIATLLPVVLSTLRLPEAISGAAIVIVLLISKIGVHTFCESTATA